MFSQTEKIGAQKPNHPEHPPKPEHPVHPEHPPKPEHPNKYPPAKPVVLTTTLKGNFTSNP